MAISRSLMNRQLYANGSGIMKLSQEGIGGGDYKGIDMGSRTGFGILDKVTDRVRKLIPNEIADIAVKAAPFVAPFNPALAGAMAGIGSFDQTGNFGDAFKRGALTYGGGQVGRYIGGAGFQGNPFGDGGAFTGGLQGFKGGFSSPIGTETGLGKFFSNRGTTGVEGVNETITPTNLNDYSGTTTEIIPTNLNDYAGKATEALASEVSLVPQAKPDQGFFSSIVEKFQNKDYSGLGRDVLDKAKEGGKALFTKPIPGQPGKTQLDKAAVFGAIAFTSSYIEAKALAAELGVDEDLTEAEYDELKKADKQEEYAGYLTNFFSGKKDGGRIGFAEGTPDSSDNSFFNLINKISPLFVDEDGDYRSGLQKAKFALSDFIAGKGYDYVTGAEWYNKLDEDTQREILLMKQKIRDNPEAYSFSPRMKELTEQPVYDEEFAGKFGYGSRYAEGGRIGFKFGTKPDDAEVGIMTIDVEAGDNEDEEDMKMAGITFSRAERAYLFKKLGGSSTSGKNKSMPNLYYILNDPGSYPADAKVLKEIAIMGMGKKDGGRIGLKGGSGSSDRVAQLMLERDYLLSKDEDVSFIDIELERDFGIKMKAEGGIMEAKMPTGQIRKNNAGVVERDYRDEGGFVPVGIKERADDVPAMLSKNEFVMTADAVRGIGNGSVEEGSKKLYNTMKQAEKVGKA